MELKNKRIYLGEDGFYILCLDTVSKWKYRMKAWEICKIVCCGKTPIHSATCFFVDKYINDSLNLVLLL